MDSSRPDRESDATPDSPAEVLAAARARRAAADRAEAELLELAVSWAGMHPAESVAEAETIRLRAFGDTGIPVAGPGAPLVAEFSVAEFAAAVGLPTEAGKRYVGRAVELRYRLPRLWKRVISGDLATWRARRVAEQTTHLNMQAAAFVDRHLAPVAHKVRPAQVDRLLEEALARFMPEEAERRRQEASEGRHFTVDHDQVSFAGTSQVHGELDLADALDLDDAVRAGAARLAGLGSTQPLDVRRAIAVGELARRDLTLDLTATPDPHADTDADPDADLDTDPDSDTGIGPDPEGGAAGVDLGVPRDREPAAPPRPPQTPAARKVVLHLHLSETAVRGRCTCPADGGEDTSDGVGRVENTRLPVTAETIREWCGRPDMKVTVNPVVDLADHVSVEAYEVPDRVAEPAVLRDISCVFPWCTRPARRLRPDDHPCDHDHAVPFNNGGPTCSCQIAPLCRRHHRLKTHGGWTYYVLEPGSYVWTSPHHYQYLRDHTGTLDISHDAHHRRRQRHDYDSGPPPAET